MRRAALALVVLAAVGACDAPFVPTLEGGPAAALFGTLDGRAPRQALRVQILGAPVLDPPPTAPGAVTSRELTSGVLTRWRDSLVTLDSGARAHLFLADLAVRPGDTHEVTATRDLDGAVATVTVRIPDPSAGAVGDGVGQNVGVTVAVADLQGRVTESVVRYRVRREDGTGERSIRAPAAVQRADGAASFVAFLGPARRRAAGELFGTENGPSPVLVEARFEAVLLSTGGVDVVGGAGEVGWAVPVSVPVRFGAEALAAAGFVDGQ